MLRMFVIITTVALSALVGCTADSKITPESVMAEIAKSCGIVVSVTDIAALILKEPTTMSIAVFAKLVCDAFNQKKAQEAPRLGSSESGVLVVKGVEIHYVTK